MKEYFKIAADIVFPRRCPLCGNIIVPKGQTACTGCKEKVEVISGPRCLKCSKPIESEEVQYCFDCMRAKHHYIKGYAVFAYEGTIKESLLQFKFKGKREYADYYSEAIITTFSDQLLAHQFDYIIPIPLHPRKLRERGFNQAQLLAQGIGDRLLLPVMPDGLMRIKYTMPQKKLDDKERLRNLEKAFLVNPAKAKLLSGKRILIVDDIYTTGSTIEACTNLLLGAGCGAVYFVTVCIGKGF